MKTIIFALLSIVLLNSSFKAQSEFVRHCPDNQIDIRKSGSSAPQSDNGLITYTNCSYITGVNVGKYLTTIRRAVYQWTITDNDIPDGSTINSVTFTFSFSNGPNEIYLNYFNAGMDITNQSLDISELWSATDRFVSTPIGSGWGSGSTTGSIVISTFTGANNPVIQAVSNSLQNNMFTLGLAWQYESPNAGDLNWNIYPQYENIKIYYTLPNQQVTINQKLNTGTNVGLLRKWEGSSFGNQFSPGTQFFFPVTSQQTIIGDQAIYSNQKYNNWNGLPDVVNHHSFTITSDLSELSSNFLPTHSGVTIKNTLEGTAINGGNVNFRDPWLIDYADPQFGNNLRNRGMDAPFKQRSSPFYPDYTTNYYGDVYGGVFLNQGSPNWTPPYYSVQAVSPQTININGRNHNFYFQNWSGSNANFQNANNITTGVVFNNANAVVNANYKGTQLSNQTDAYENNSQRKFLANNSNILFSVYESMEKVWIEYSTNNGQTWLIGNEGKPLFGGQLAKNPSMEIWNSDYTTSNIFVVAQINDGEHKISVSWSKWTPNQFKEWNN